jgi:type I restriction enzyme S subunit
LDIAKLADIVEVASGGGAPQNADAFTAHGIPFIRAGSLNPLVNGASEDSLEHVTEEVAKEHGLRKFPPNTVVFAKSGMSATKGHVYRLRGDAYVVNHLAALVPGKRVDPRFLEHSLRVFSPTRLIQDAAYPSIRLSDLSAMHVPLPSLVEQQRIAAILDKAEDLRTKRRAALEQLDTASASIFFELFPHHKQTPITVGDELQDHPRGWPWQLLKKAARLATGHTPDRKRLDYWNGTIPWITLSEIRRFDGTKAYDTAEHISELGLDNSSAVKLPHGTVCFSRTASVGFVTVMGREMATSQDFVNWVCGPDLEPMYLMHAFLRSRDRLRSLSTGSTHKTIYFPTVEQFRVLVPPIDLQREFVGRIEGVDKLKSSLRASLAEMDTLFISLQHCAFRGEL